MNNDKIQAPSGGKYLGVSLLSGTVAAVLWAVAGQISMSNSPDAAARGMSGLNIIFLPFNILPAALLSAIVLALLHYGIRGGIPLRFGFIIATIVSFLGLQVWSIFV